MGQNSNGKISDNFCRDLGIRQELTVVDTPEQNGIAERSFGVLNGKTRAILKDADFGERRYCQQST